MKATFFNKPLEWNIEIQGESWQQGQSLNSILRLKNHSNDKIVLGKAGLGLCYAEVKKVHAREEGALKLEESLPLEKTEISPNDEIIQEFTFKIKNDSPVTDKKSSYFLSYGRNFAENHIQLSILPNGLYLKIIGLLDTFHRFKLKEYRNTKNGVEFKLLPPSSRETANINDLCLFFSLDGNDLKLEFNFTLKKIDHTSVTTKIKKETLKIAKTISSKEYTLGGDMINQDGILKVLGTVLEEVKLTNIY